ncbi:MAG: PilZ domain-containing protein, partial [Deltaproteobacteria bacterium]|nr:PilZ domain-containing protein [Deltaproteobacteria bacterium]
FYEGQLDNYSRNGLFIQANEDLLVGEVVTVVDPNPDGDNEKRQGQIVWKNSEGFGVELFHSRDEWEQKALRIENRIIHREGHTIEA